ncbi:hypothetical protein HGRIS_005907 [Hohenbuehelia grisea]|uniref:Uncharacterized protein n=1 Tax=Hohenbuehelia grisea TaxID=104357 RepID=A0ABR3K0L3_9AGAR
MPSKHQSKPDELPSLLWVTIPTLLLISGYFARKWYLSYRLKKHGIGKGAPGFQTGTRKLKVTPEIAARIRRGEEVTAAEITAAAAEMEAREARGLDSTPAVPSTTTKSKKPSPPPVNPAEPVNEWLPESIRTPQKRGKAKRK